MPISIIVDPTRKSSAAFAPLAILGGMINITGLAFSNVRDVELTNNSHTLTKVYLYLP
ncbi:hypothetical protein FACS189496_4060 [Bacilli bacterium]|nr:hypothetical protein FACS189496_4060 [Bacilli bacterium]